MMEKKWTILERKSDDIIEQLLINRKIAKGDRDDFLNPDYDKDLHDPFKMAGMKEAVARIIRAIKKKEKVGIFGDYDADGVPAAVILYEILNKHGLEVEIYIPSREEGYGLNEAGIKYLADKGVTLMITVDLGVTCKAEIEFAKSLGVETIVTDHHEVIKELWPDQAIAIIDSRQKNCRYPFKGLSGAAIAYKLGVALAHKTGEIGGGQLKWWLDLVGISTFCDMVPLIGENRVLAKYGLIVLEKTKRAGLEQLYQLAGIDRTKISEYTVSFLIGPRLNAPGRMNAGNVATKLLLARDEKEARRYASDLENSNRERQGLLKKILEEAEQRVADKKLYKKKVVIVAGENWPEGIIGLVAGKLSEKYGRPAIVLNRRDKISKGSARSIEGFHMVEILNECQQYLIKHGGHAKAAGLTVANEHLENLYDRIWELAEEKLVEEDLKPEIICDMEIDFKEINYAFYKILVKFAPFGMGNRRPVFMTRGVEIVDFSLVGNGGGHLKMELAQGKEIWRGIGFDLGEKKDEIKKGEKIDIVYTLDYDGWLGGENLQLKVLDFKKAS